MIFLHIIMCIENHVQCIITETLANTRVMQIIEGGAFTHTTLILYDKEVDIMLTIAY